MIAAEKRKRQGKQTLALDPRTWLLLIVMTNVALFFVPSMRGEAVLTTLALVLVCLTGVRRLALKIGAIYFTLLIVDYLAIVWIGSGVAVYIALFARFIRKVMPCALLGGALIATTRVNAFMAALTKMKVPRRILMPLTVMMRYIPAIGEDARKITHAMKMRGISPTPLSFCKQPWTTIECLYVPIMLSASRRADELSAAAVSRGIENPKPRTSVQVVRFGVVDGVVSTAAGVALILIWRL